MSQKRGRKKKIKDAISLKAQGDAHEKLAEDPDVDVGEHTKKYWKKEAVEYHHQLEKIIERAQFPQIYIEEIEQKGKERGEKLYQKKKEKVKNQKQRR